jgi:hypothetical protein
MRRTSRLLGPAALLLAVALVAAACGGGDDDGSAPQPPGSEEPAPVLPTNDDPGATPPAAAGACLEGEPDCVDTLVGDPVPLPPPGDDPAGDDGGPVVSGGMLVDGGLTVSEALATDATGVIAVRGFLLDDGSGARLCEALAESYPPQCGVASIAVTGYEEMVDVPLVQAQGVTWTDQTVSLLGEIVDGVLVVDPMVAG